MSFDSRITELISIGVSVGVNCQPCLQYHISKAKELGISEQEIRNAIMLGKSVRKGAAYKMDQYITELNAAPQTEADSISCCGGSC